MTPGPGPEQQQGRGRQRKAKEGRRQKMTQPVQERTVPGAALLLKELRPPDDRRPGGPLDPSAAPGGLLEGLEAEKVRSGGGVWEGPLAAGGGWEGLEKLHNTIFFLLFLEKKKMTNLFESTSLESYF